MKILLLLTAVVAFCCKYTNFSNVILNNNCQARCFEI
jgi:hypothetical protein